MVLRVRFVYADMRYDFGSLTYEVICSQKHKVWVLVFLVRMSGTLSTKMNRLGEMVCFATNPHLIQRRERSGSVVNCLSVVDLSLNGVTALYL